MPTHHADAQQLLLAELRRAHPGELEELTAHLLGCLLDIPFVVASAGNQFGADAGTAGYRGRHLRAECKRYSHGTPISAQEAFGHVARAFTEDESLEVWILVTTQAVSEQVQSSLRRFGEKSGLPIVIVDWSQERIPLLAALCTVAPESLGHTISESAQDAAAALASTSEIALGNLKRDLESWSIGFTSIRRRSIDHLKQIWKDPRYARAALGHDVAGGARSARVTRKLPSEELTRWWHNRSSDSSPAVIVGLEGTGKTWATIDWLVAHQDRLPVVVVIASSAVTREDTQSAGGFKRFLAVQLHALAGVRDETYWQKRLDQWLSGPEDSAPHLVLVLDGLNQHSTVPWPRLLQQTQSPEFAGRLRVVLNTRTHHFTSKLARLRRLVDDPTVITLANYSDDEMDQMLQFHDLTQADLASDVLDLARTPGLFDIVVSLRKNLPTSGLTLHRVIWEYGRGSLGRHGDVSLTEDEWLDWLRVVAKKCRDNVMQYTPKSLLATATRPDLTENEVYGRLSDIIDGKLVVADHGGGFRLRPDILAHALALALLDHLTTRLRDPTCECVHQELAEWLDPIERLDQTAQILRAAVAILVAQGRAEQPPIPSAVVTTWLHTQNAPETHRQEVVAQANEFPTALLDAIERSNSLTHNASRRVAMLALRNVSRQDGEAMQKVFSRVTGWLRVISLTTRHDGNAASIPEWSSEHFLSRIGTDREGFVKILGGPFQLVMHEAPYCKAVIPAIIEGFPLALAQRVFEALAIHESVALGQSLWNDFRWITCLNGNDYRPTAAVLRSLANDIASRPAESGIDVNLPSMVARRILLLTGNEKDEEAARLLHDSASPGDPAYVGRLSSSLLPIDVRCREIMMRDAGPELCSQAQSLSDLWADPRFQPSQSLIETVVAEAAQVEVAALVHNAGRTREELFFDSMVPAMARCCPNVVANIARQRLRALGSCPEDARFRSASEGTDHFLLTDDVTAAAARALRRSSIDDDDGREAHAAANLLLLELFNVPFREQCRALIDSDLKSIPADFATVLNRADRQDIDFLVAEYGSGSAKGQYDLLSVLSLLPWGSANGTLLSAETRCWLEQAALHQEDRSRQLAFKILCSVDPKRFGQLLATHRWTWGKESPEWVNHYGTDALVEATLSVSFAELAPRLAPWRLLAAARRRGGLSGDVRLAAAILANVVNSDSVITVDDSLADVTVDPGRAALWPLAYSVEPRPVDYGDGREALARAMDVDSQVQDALRATNAVSQAVSTARSAGASLYHIHFDTMDLALVVDHAPDFVDRWLQGLSAETPELTKRIRLAEGFYLALCEVLLEHDPKRGVQLWHTICKTKTVRFAGPGSIDWMIVMPFRAAESEPVVELRDHILSPSASNTDEALLDLAVAARACGETDWLNQCSEQDLSTGTWHRERGIVLQGFAAHEPLAITCPLAQVSTSDPGAYQRQRAAGWLRSWVSASHWWDRYKMAGDPSEAYAAWMLFLHSVDRRSLDLMEQEIAGYGAQQRLSRAKLAHAVLNRHNVKRAAKEREAKLDQGYLFRRVGKDVGPWMSD